MIHTKYFFLTVIWIFIASCANQVAPTGGDKDVKPPKVTKSVPENFSTGFDSKKIEINFDEYIQLKDLNGQLIVSPPLSKIPVAKIKQKSLIIQLDDTLHPNTTYTLNFGNSIIDNNEGNVLEDYQYVFSTGDVIDSLKISGKVQNAFDKKTEKGILVMLYKDQDDSMPLKNRPDYFAKTNDKGEFHITNIAPATYKIIALKESNSDYLFNASEESVAFSELPAEPGAMSLTLRLFREKPKQHLQKSFSEEPGKAVFIFNQPATDVTYRFMTDTAKINLAFVEESKKKDTLVFWYRNVNLDSLVLYFSNDQEVHDTVAVRLFKGEGKTFSRRKNSLFINSNFAKDGILDLNKDLSLQFNHPVLQSDFSKISLKEDTVELKDLLFTFTDSLKRNLAIRHKWKEKTRYHLFILPSAFTDLFGIKNDTLLSSFQTRLLTDYGTLALKMKPGAKSKQYVVMLMDDNETIYRTSVIQGDTTLNYGFLDPKTYRLKLIEDVNSNGEWDTGNYLQKIQPENVLYYPETITIRANWDVDVTWKPEFLN